MFKDPFSFDGRIRRIEYFLSGIVGGFVLLGLWLVMNIGLVMSLLGSLSGYLLPLTLLIIGIVLFWFAKR